MQPIKQHRCVSARTPACRTSNAYAYKLPPDEHARELRSEQFHFDEMTVGKMLGRTLTPHDRQTIGALLLRGDSPNSIAAQLRTG